MFNPLMRVIPFLLLVTSSTAPMACPYTALTQELVDKAKTIFIAKITEVKLAKLPIPTQAGQYFEVVEARYEIKEVLKGVPSPTGIVRDAPMGIGNCNIGLYPGVEYVLLPGVDEIVLSSTGSFGYINAEGTSVRPKIDLVRRLVAAGK